MKIRYLHPITSGSTHIVKLQCVSLTCDDTCDYLRVLAGISSTVGTLGTNFSHFMSLT